MTPAPQPTEGDLREALGERPDLNDPDFERRLSKAYCVQQSQVPDQSAIVWRSDLLQLFHKLWRTQGLAKSATTPPSEPAPDLREAASALMARWPTDQHDGSPMKEEADAVRKALQSRPGVTDQAAVERATIERCPCCGALPCDWTNNPHSLCDCPPVGYVTDKTRCLPCPRRTSGGGK